MSDRSRVLALGALVLIGVGILALLLQAKHLLLDLLELVQSMGPWGPLLFVVIYIAGCVLFLPGSILTIAAGFLFGLWIGTITVSVGSTLGAGVAFLLARTLMRDWITSKVTKVPRFRALDEAVGKHGFKIVLLTRLSPVFPFNMLNLVYGITSVSLRDYMLASWIGMLPGAILYVYLGTAMKNLAELAIGREQATTPEKILFVLGLAATAILLAVLARIARRALNDEMPERESMKYVDIGP